MWRCVMWGIIANFANRLFRFMRKNSVVLIFLLTVITSCGRTVTLDEAELMDKIRGGWYAQTIGCTYGGPTEFKFKGCVIPDSISLGWNDECIHDMFVRRPGLYDDVYMDLTFLEVMAEHGIDAGRELYAEKFADAPYLLWHANQAARYNILHGCKAPESGFWMNNPHADDIDFQIESDFIGMLTPGRPDIASGFCDTIGHIMNYGNGWYGGVFTAAMYSYAYVYDNVEKIVRKAARMIPEGTGFRSCIDDVLLFHRRNPECWKDCWDMVQEKHSHDVGCPNGVWDDFDIDATINAAYVVIGLLYGEGNFLNTIEISTRCGQDSDCNPATAAGILGVMYGYEAIPDDFRKSAELISDIPFPYTSLSLNDVCGKNLELLKEALGAESCRKPGKVVIRVMAPSPVPYEQSFEGIRPKDRIDVCSVLKDSLSLAFDGSAFVIRGEVRNTVKSDRDYTARIEVSLDGGIAEVVEMPADYRLRKPDVYYKYGLENKGHSVSLRLLNPDSEYCVNVGKVIVYENSEPVSPHPRI